MSGYGAEKQELSCISVFAVLQYMEKALGKEGMAAEVEQLGLPLAFLRNKRNWVSFEYYNRLLERMVERLGDPAAPFKAAFSVQPETVYDFVLYAAYATLWTGSPRPAYLISMGSRFYKRWTKIGDFQILGSTATTLQIRMTLKQGYVQTRNNCLAVQGILASVPTGMGLPAAEIVEDECAAEGGRGCVYHLRWRNRSNLTWFLMVPSFAATAFVGYLTLGRGFTASHVLATALAFFSAGLLVRNIQYWNSLRLQEHVSRERNEHMVETMKRIENDYRQILDSKIRLEEKNRYLTVVNSLASLISHEGNFDSLIRGTFKMLGEHMDFRKGEFFRWDSASRTYGSMFEPGHRVLEGEYRSVMGRGEGAPFRVGKEEGSAWLREWNDRRAKEDLYLVPLGSAGAPGFFCFAIDPGSRLSPSLIGTLFSNVSNQLKIALSRIATRAAIDGILGSIPASVLIFRADDGAAEYANARFIETFAPVAVPKGAEDEGEIVAGVVGAPLSRLLPFDSRTLEKVMETARLLGLGARSEVMEATIGDRIYELSAFEIPQEDQAHRLAGIIVNDISEAKYFQKNLLIDQKLLALGRVASGIAHEINNPLYAVLANAEELADDEAASAETRQLAREIVDHVVNVSNVIKDLSNYSRALRKEERAAVDLNAIVEEALTLVKYSSNFLEISVEKELEPLPPVFAPKGELQQVFINLFNNAIQAMGGRGTIRVSSRVEGTRIFVVVRDSGPGIPPEILPNIFGLFFTTKKPGEGTGQGLYIVRKILGMYGGKVRAGNHPEGGAEFVVELASGVPLDA